MIGRTNAGGGGGGLKVSVTLYGAKNEVITFTGKDTGTVTLDANGTGTATLKKGSYNFTGGVSGFVKSNVEISGDTTVYVRPQRIIYWYGVKAETMDIDGSNYSSPSITENENSITVSAYSNSVSSSYNYMTVNKIDISSFSSLHGICEKATGNNFSVLTYTDNRNSVDLDVGGSFPSDAKSTATFDISSVTGSHYVGIAGGAYNRPTTREIIVYAFWLE